MMGRLQSIRQKMLVIVLTTTLVALLLALIGNVLGDMWRLKRSLAADMDTQAELLGQVASAALAFDDAKLAADNLRALQTRPMVRAAAIYNDRGKLFASYSGSGTKETFPVLPEAEGVRILGKDLMVSRRIVRGGDILGTIYLRADYDLSRTVLDNLLKSLVASMFPLIAAFFMISHLEKIVTRPIAAVAQAAREVVRQRDYARRVDNQSNDEVGALVESFNNMLGEIERRTMELEASNQKISREVEQHARAQQEIMRLNVDLENRVRTRTAELEQAMALAEHANQAKSAFLSSMSHELRTPLNAILGFAQLLASEVLVVTAERRKEFTGFILKAGTHLLNLINEILDLAKVESGEFRLSMEPVQLAQVIAECQAMIEPLGQQRHLQMAFPVDLPYTVLADRTRLKQILLNLLSNGIKYNRESGMLAVACAPSGERRVRISVHDSGAGLDTGQLEGLFQPFNRLGQDTGPVEGTGIGLVVTKRLVELMNGTIGVSSTVGVGSVFWIELHALDPGSPSGDVVDTDSPATAAAVSQRVGLSTLLYIEDNPANLRLVEEIIRLRPDLRLFSAPDAHLGLQLARAHLPDLILMDLHLPGMSGTETLKVLRADPATAHIPVIAVTASVMPRDVEAGMASGFFAYVAKPINVVAFMDAINSALDATSAPGARAQTARPEES